VEKLIVLENSKIGGNVKTINTIVGFGTINAGQYNIV
jgi:hypothetical protein